MVSNSCRTTITKGNFSARLDAREMKKIGPHLEHVLTTDVIL